MIYNILKEIKDTAGAYHSEKYANILKSQEGSLPRIGICVQVILGRTLQLLARKYSIPDTAIC